MENSFRLERTDSAHPDFVKLVKMLDEDLTIRDGTEHAFYDQFNKIEGIRYALVAYDGPQPVGCGAIKYFDNATMEVKRMFVLPEKRGSGIATRILEGLEHWCLELGFYKCILETGTRQPEAISLYRRQGYQVTPNYGQYSNVANSICFLKSLAS